MNFSGIFDTINKEGGCLEMDNNFYDLNEGISIEDYTFHFRKEAKRKIKSHSNHIGICILAFLCAPFVLATTLQIFGIYDFYLSNNILQYSIELFFNVAFLFLPFFLVYIFYDKDDKACIEQSFEKFSSPGLFLSAIGFGLMLCFIGDYVSGWVSDLFQLIGITLTSTGEIDVPTSGLPLFLFAFSMIVPPAIIEEFTMRAVTMQPLRKYGDKFAIVMTALVFGLMHRNAVQGIFAFIAGIIFGYLTISTKSIWTSVIVHALNNGYYVFINVLNTKNSELANEIHFIAVIVIFAIGIICSIFFVKNKKRQKLTCNTQRIISVKEKTSRFIFSIPMIISILWMLLYTIFGW